MSMIHQLAAFMVGTKYEFLRAYMIASWLWGIILNLFLVRGFYGVALGNLGLALGILALAHLNNHSQNKLSAAYAVAKRRS